MSNSKTVVIVVAVVVFVAVLVGGAVFYYVNKPSGGGGSGGGGSPTCATTPCAKGTCSKDGTTCVKCSDPSAGACPGSRTCDTVSGNCTSCTDAGAPPCKAGTKCNVTTGDCENNSGTACDASYPCPAGYICTAGQCVSPPGSQYFIRFLRDDADPTAPDNYQPVLCATLNNSGRQGMAFPHAKSGGCAPMMVTMEGSGHNGVGPGMVLKDSLSGLYLHAHTGIPTFSLATEPQALMYYNDAHHLFPVDDQAHNISGVMFADNTMSWIVYNPDTMGPNIDFPKVVLQPVPTGVAENEWWAGADRRSQSQSQSLLLRTAASGALEGCGGDCAAPAAFPPK